MKLKKQKKCKRMRGKGMGTHGWGARKKHMGSGHRGGFGMAGTGKKAGQKITLVKKLYGNSYFGKQGITSKSTERKKNPVMNLAYIESNLEMLKRKFGQKDGTLNLKDYKILGEGDIKMKLLVNALAVSKSARDKIEKVGGKVTVPEMNKNESNEEKKE